MTCCLASFTWKAALHFRSNKLKKNYLSFSVWCRLTPIQAGLKSKKTWEWKFLNIKIYKWQIPWSICGIYEVIISWSLRFNQVSALSFTERLCLRIGLPKHIFSGTGCFSRVKGIPAIWTCCKEKRQSELQNTKAVFKKLLKKLTFLFACSWHYWHLPCGEKNTGKNNFRI